MKTLHTRIAAILTVAAMGITMSACSKDEESSSESSQGVVVTDAANANIGNTNETLSEEEYQQALETLEGATIDASGVLKQDMIFGVDMGGEDEVQQDATEPATEAPTVVVTKQVTVTEAGGEPATDAKGEAVTEVVTSIQTEAVQYVPSIFSDYIYWLDMSDNNGEYDKVFNGEMFVFEFKIKDNVPDGNYEITLSNPDFVNWDEEQLDVKTINGYVTVGDAAPAQSAQVQPGQFTVAAVGGSGKVGDTVKVVINASDNPGLVGLLLRVSFDQNALELVDSYEGSALG